MGEHALTTTAAVPRRAVFLDRDGTLNAPVVRDGKPYAPTNPDEFVLLPGVDAACRRLHAAGFVLVVATNQPDVGRGLMAAAAVEAMHDRLRRAIPEIARIETCVAPGRGTPHAEDYRRKPEPGMLTDAARALNLDLAHSWMVGDRWRDIECGHRAGCGTILIDWAYEEEAEGRPPHHRVRDLTAAAAIILAAQASR